MADGFPHLQLDTDFLDSEEATAFTDVTGDEDDAWRLPQLWMWLARHRPTGDLRDIKPGILAKKAGWTRDPQEFVDALEAADLLVDETLADISPDLDGTEVRRFRGWGKRYDRALAKRFRDRARKRLKAPTLVAASRGDSAATPRAVAASRGVEERRGEERIGEDPLPSEEGVQGDGPSAAPPPAAPEPPPTKAKRKAKKSGTKRDHRGMGANSVGPGSPPQWPPTTIRELCEMPIEEGSDETCWVFWKRTFPGFDGMEGRPSLKERVQEAWDFWIGDGRKGRWKTPTGFTKSIRGFAHEAMNHERALRSKERTMREARGGGFNEQPGANRSRDTRNGGLGSIGDYGRGPGDLNVEGRSGGVRATDAIVEGIRAAKPTTPEDDEAAEAWLSAMKGGR